MAKLKEKEFEKLLESLKEAAAQMEVQVRFEKGDFKGGYCLLKDSRVIVINKMSNFQRKVMTLAAALKELGIENIDLEPKLKFLIDEIGENN